MKTNNNKYTPKNPRQFAMDRTFNLFITVGLISLYLAFVTFDENDVGFFVFLMILGAFFLAGGIFTTPYGYFFDNEGVSARYVFYSEERYLWRNIYFVMITDVGASSRNPIFDFIFSRVFEIGGEVEGKKRFYMNGYIRKSRRTRRLIEKYWDGRITNEFAEERKKSRKKSQNTTELKLLSEEIAALERTVRASSRKWVEPFKAQADSMGLEIRCDYIYITPDLDEKRSRPNSPYKYTMMTEICRKDEKDEDKIVLIDVDLLKVRLGKRAYRGVENKKAEAEFFAIMRETLDEIKEKGIEALLSSI